MSIPRIEVAIRSIVLVVCLVALGIVLEKAWHGALLLLGGVAPGGVAVAALVDRWRIALGDSTAAESLAWVIVVGGITCLTLMITVAVFCAIHACIRAFDLVGPLMLWRDRRECARR